jgi:hypothetical protein
MHNKCSGHFAPAGSIGYLPRLGETAATLESTATTATAQHILVVNGSKNLRWEGVRFEYATWLGASGPQGFVDTQSAFLYRELTSNHVLAIMYSFNSDRLLVQSCFLSTLTDCLCNHVFFQL